MRTMALSVLIVLSAGMLVFCRPGARMQNQAAQTTDLRFEVTVRAGLLTAPQDGRLLVVLNPNRYVESRSLLGDVGTTAVPVMGKDVKGFQAGKTAVIDRQAVIFPIEHLAKLPKGAYYVQAVFDYSRDIRQPNAPGNLYSETQKVRLDPEIGGVVKIELTKQIPAEPMPSDTEWIKYVKIQSRLLSDFHKRPIYLRAGVILPRDYEKAKDRRYPLIVSIGGFGSRYTGVQWMMSAQSGFRQAWLAEDAPRMVLLHLDGAGPLGDPYQVNSANNGPYGDAVVKELIPYVEKRFRGLGKPWARFLTGGSTGGWVSLALQVFYPDFFNGCWSGYPDSVDFRAYQLVNIYQDENAYVDEEGQEIPACRTPSGKVVFTVRHECQMENVLGAGDNWAMSGQQWGSWNAVYGPRGKDGRPIPLWDPKTGRINRSVREHWKKYDLRLVLEQNWKTLGPKLRGKIHVWVGEMDNYYLNNAVHLLDRFLSKANPPYEGTIRYGPGQGHGWEPYSWKELLQQMAKRMGVER